MKHQPKGLTILFEDNDLIFIDKPAGLLSMGTEKEKQKTAHFLLNEYVKMGNKHSKNRVFIVHRLDRETSGVLVFAKNEPTKIALQENWHDFHKTYVTIIHGQLKQKEGEISSYLTENNAFRVFSVKDPNQGKFAKTGYKVIKESNKFSLLEVELFTGRKHQIRVHFSEMGNPVVGDVMYGNESKIAKNLALHSASLSIKHPVTKEELTIKAEIPLYFKSIIKF
jgi:RluA family pseudouridine synthase